MNPMPSPTPAEIRELRTALGLTQAEFGELVDSARRTVEDWEAGRRNMPPLKFKVAQDKLKRRRKK